MGCGKKFIWWNLCKILNKLTSHVGDFNEHSGHQVDTLEQLLINVHVEGHLPLLFDLLLFFASLMLTLHGGKRIYCEQLIAIKDNKRIATKL